MGLPRKGSIIFLLVIIAKVNSDSPCNAREAEGSSVVCVCNSSYCDTVTRESVNTGEYVVYTSSQDGLRFQKTRGSLTMPDFEGVWNDTLTSYDENFARNDAQLTIDTRTRYQTIIGFGGSTTDASGVNWRSLSQPVQDHFINSYCSSDGLEYNLFRVPIGGCDFSTRPYAYNELPEDDINLSNYTLTMEDYEYKIPMIKGCRDISPHKIKVFASTWAPPLWMKTNNRYGGIGRLRPEYYQTYADYHLRFLEEYEKEGVELWGITTTNEPTAGLVGAVRWNSVGFTAADQARWISNNLGPLIRGSRFKDTKIICMDDQRFSLPYWMIRMQTVNASSIDYVDGIAVHWYWNSVTPASLLSMTNYLYPSKFIVASEACEGSWPWQALNKVRLGSWSRAESYIRNIMEDLNHFVAGWVDWNMALDARGGPNWALNFVDAPIIVLEDQDEFVKQPMFYAMGHFSKFIPPGSQRVRVNAQNVGNIEHLAFVTPSGNVVIVLYNRSRESQQISINAENRLLSVEIGPKTIQTIEMNIFFGVISNQNDTL